jgi:hypothetical protein
VSDGQIGVVVRLNAHRGRTIETTFVSRGVAGKRIAVAGKDIAVTGTKNGVV